MKNLFIIFTFFSFLASYSQENEPSFKKGEWLRYRIHYGLLNAGYSTLTVHEAIKFDKEMYHVVGKGRSTGIVSLFFRVKDDYESYFDKEDYKPYHFIRRVNEGGYTINRDIYFNYENNTAFVKDHKKKTEKTTVISDVHDMMSAFYYLRNQDTDKLKINDELNLDMFFDNEVFPFRLKLVAREIIQTKFGKVKCMKMRPLVQSGRVFKEQESLTLWVTDDKNRIPIRIKASLAIGSLRADLDAYKGLAHPFEIIFDN